MNFKLGVFMIFCTAVLFALGNSATSQAAEKNNSEEIEATVCVSSPMVMVSTAQSGLGVITGNGVRLRSKASTNSEILETLYMGEKVKVNKAKSDKGDKWLYITRKKTGTTGWVLGKYVSW